MDRKMVYSNGFSVENISTLFITSFRLIITGKCKILNHPFFSAIHKN